MLNPLEERKYYNTCYDAGCQNKYESSRTKRTQSANETQNEHDKESD
jgi:hypothetical protein